MNLLLEVQIRIDAYGGPQRLAEDIEREWGFFADKPANKMLIDRGNFYKPWSKNDVTFLKTWHGKISADKMARRLKRTKHSIETMANKIGLPAFKKIPWAQHEIYFLIENYPYLKINQLQAALNKDTNAIAAQAYRLKLKKAAK